jgi:DNA-binding NarL/FixJ family response regulator
VGARLQAAYSRALAARALAAAGTRPEAVAALREAESELDACGSVRVRDEMRRELRKLGARAEVRGPAVSGDSGVAALTKRELEIAELVTDRHTNREIAAALFLSDKTIESHLRNIFVKLGVSSRVAVARAVERERRGDDAAA